MSDVRSCETQARTIGSAIDGCLLIGTVAHVFEEATANLGIALGRSSQR